MKTYLVQERGYSLVETLVAVSILLLSIVGPMTIAAKGIQTGIYVGDQTTAMFLAQEQIESVAAIRNQYGLEYIGTPEVWDWADTSGPLAGCFAPSGCNIKWVAAAPFYDIDQCGAANGNCRVKFDSDGGTRSRYTVDITTDPNTMYTRVLRLTRIGPNEVVASTTVSWNANLFGGQRSVTLRSSFFNLYE
jgi:type II secretory pathway pseudopilin PulG